jgi:hypothetical protein
LDGRSLITHEATDLLGSNARKACVLKVEAGGPDGVTDNASSKALSTLRTTIKRVLDRIKRGPTYNKVEVRRRVFERDLTLAITLQSEICHALRMILDVPKSLPKATMIDRRSGAFTALDQLGPILNSGPNSLFRSGRISRRRCWKLRRERVEFSHQGVT